MPKSKHSLYTMGRRLDDKQTFRGPPDTYERPNACFIGPQDTCEKRDETLVEHEHTPASTTQPFVLSLIVFQSDMSCTSVATGTRAARPITFAFRLQYSCAGKNASVKRGTNRLDVTNNTSHEVDMILQARPQVVSQLLAAVVAVYPH